MKITLYKLLEIEDSPESSFDRTQVLTEQELRDIFCWYLKNGYLNEENLKDNNISIDTNREIIMESTDINTIIDIFIENGEYDSEQVFLIQPIEINI